MTRRPDLADPWDAWLARLVDDAREKVPRMKFELRRKAIHVAGAIAGVVLLAFIPMIWAIGLGLLTIAVVSAVHFAKKRRMRVDHPLLQVVHDPISRALDDTRRPGEDYPWAPVTFAIALLAVGYTSIHVGLPFAFSYAAFGILGVGDAASALIGIAYGKRKLPWNPRKSWEGTLAGAICGFVAAVVLASFHYSLLHTPFPPQWFAIAGAGALAGALVESAPKVQDNLFVPVAAFAAMWAAGAALGVV